MSPSQSTTDTLCSAVIFPEHAEWNEDGPCSGLGSGYGWGEGGDSSNLLQTQDLTSIFALIHKKFWATPIVQNTL